MVNAHHHLLQSAFRTAPHTRHVPMREWLAAMGELYSQAQVDPQLVAAAAAVAIAEGLLCGVTTVADHHLTWPVAMAFTSTMPKTLVGIPENVMVMSPS